MPKIIISEDALKLARAISGEFKKIADKCIKEKGLFFIALSGGSTPQLYLERLSKVFTSWQKVHIFWSDERCVPPNNAESNYNMIKENFLQLIDIPSINIHRIRGEDDPDEEAGRYSKEILDWVPVENGLPCFDLILLGVGEDGHTASIFPDQMQLMTSNYIYDTSFKPETGSKRITITGRTINNAQNVIFAVSGKNKAAITSRILNKDTSSNELPAALIAPAGGALKWYLDKDASQNLNL